MKKNKTILTTLSVLGILSLMFVQKALADVLPDGDWNNRNRPNINLEPKKIIDLIEPLHIIIGGAVLVIVIISFVALFKMRKK